MNSYIIAPPRYALAKFGAYRITVNPEHPKPVAFSGNMESTNVQGLLDLIIEIEKGKFNLEVKNTYAL